MTTSPTEALFTRLVAAEASLGTQPLVAPAPKSVLESVCAMVKRLNETQDRTTVEFFDKLRLLEALLDYSDASLQAHVFTTQQKEAVLVAAYDDLRTASVLLETLSVAQGALDVDAKSTRRMNRERVCYLFAVGAC
jgi:hypothetical protein